MSAEPEVLFKIGAVKNFVIFTGKHLFLSLFLIKHEGLQETPTQVLYCEYSGSFKNSFLYRTSLVATSLSIHVALDCSFDVNPV